MKSVELSLNDWLELYNRLCEAERLLAEAEAAAGAEAISRLRLEVDHLRSEVDAALHGVSDRLHARNKHIM